jgi:transcriptional regulator with XRE-family HTH domain
VDLCLNSILAKNKQMYYTFAMIVKKKITTGEDVANPDNFSQRLKNLRRSLKYTQEEFSKILHISKPTLVRYEAGERKPDADLLAVLADRFNVNCNWLITGKEEMFLPSNELKFPGIIPDIEIYRLLELMEIPEIRRSILAYLDQLTFIFKPLVEQFYTRKQKPGKPDREDATNGI